MKKTGSLVTDLTNKLKKPSQALVDLYQSADEEQAEIEVPDVEVTTKRWKSVEIERLAGMYDMDNSKLMWIHTFKDKLLRFCGDQPPGCDSGRNSSSYSKTSGNDKTFTPKTLEELNFYTGDYK